MNPFGRSPFFVLLGSLVVGWAVPRLTSFATYKEGRLRAAWVLFVRKLIIYLRLAQHKKSGVCKPAPTALPIIGSTSDCLGFLSALYLCSHQPSW